jgi:pimeloyl-ACP methyl ester carboxylesterase
VSTFIFVLGAWHGAWCWQRLVTELEARGHRSVVMDLPVEDGDATFEDYAETVLASYPANLEGGVLVGYSLGAMVLPLRASLRPSNPREPLFMPIAPSTMRGGPSSGCARKTPAASGIVHTRCGDFRRFLAQPLLQWTTRPSLLNSAEQSPSRDLVSTPSRFLVPTRRFLPVRASSLICSTS